MKFAPILALVPVVLLAACDGKSDDTARAATGEVLEGTISDAMLPVDTVRSQPPLAEPEAAASASARAATGATPGGDATDTVSATDDAPAAEPTPEAAED